MDIPNNNRWTQLNDGDVSGVLHETYNQTLSVSGKASLSKRPVAIMSSEQDEDFQTTLAIVYFANNYIAITTDKVFKGGLLGNTWSQETQFNPDTTVRSDAIVFNDELIVTEDDQTASWDGSTGDQYTREALTAGVPHPLAIFDSMPTYKLAIGNGNALKLVSTSFANSPDELILADQFVITTLAYRSGFLYVGTKTTDGSEARIFIWNGNGTNAQYEVPVGCENVYSIVPYGSSVAAVLSSGRVIQVAGSSAVDLAYFPIYNEKGVVWQGASVTNQKVFHRGMVAVDDKLYINIEGQPDTGFMPAMKSGLWVYDPEVGLYHKATASTDRLVLDASLAVADDTITTTAAHNLTTGDGVQFYTISGLTGVEIDKTYYATVISDTKIKLSLTRDAVAAGNFESIGGTPGSFDRLFYFPNTDRGSQDTRSGAIALTSIQETMKSSLASEVLWGTTTKDQSGNDVNVLSVFHDSNNSGSHQTQRISARNITQAWNKIITFIDGLLIEDDKVLLKVQQKSQPNQVLLSGIWTGTNTLNSNGTVSGWGDIKEGNEIVFFDGRGQGRTAHVVEINNEYPTKTMTIDEDWGVANDSITFYYNRNIKLNPQDMDNKIDTEYLEHAIVDGKPSAWISLKTETRGADITINKYNLDETSNS